MHSYVMSLGLLVPFLVPDPGASSPIRWTDLDRDGQEDVLVLGAGGELHVFLAAPEGFREAGPSWGLKGLPRARSLDVDASGRLLLIGVDGALRLLNPTGSAFEDVTFGSGLEALGPVAEAAFLDYDADGTGDVQVLASDGRLLLFHGGAGGAFERNELVAAGAPAGRTLLPPKPGPNVSTQTPATESSGGGAEVRAGEGLGGLGSLSAPARSRSGAETFGRLGSEEGPTRGRGVVVTPLPDPSGPFTEVPETLLPGGCASGLSDQGGGACIPASTSPTLGHLLPLGPEFFVDSFGQVGIGTVAPEGLLHVVGGIGEVVISSTGLFNPQTRLNMASSADPQEGMQLRTDGAGMHVYSRTEDVLGVPQTYGPLLTVQKNRNPRVGIGTSLPQETLDVSGTALVERLELRSGLNETVELVGTEAAGNGAQLALGLASGAKTIVLDAELGSAAAELSLFDRSGTETFEILSQESGAGSRLVMRNSSGIATVVADSQTSGGGEFSLRDSQGNETVEILSEEVTGNGSQILLRDSSGQATITLDANQGGDGRITTEILEITGGSDLVEGFETSQDCPAGSVVVIDAARPGALKLSNVPYDTCVAGVVSGAGGVRAGLRLGQSDVLDGALNGETPVALTGRVLVRCTDENGPIRPGDLLTTSSTSGAAMRAGRDERANGAVLGKAMGALEQGAGLVLVLVNLQ